MGGPDIPEHTTTTTEVKLPAWVEKASEENYQFAQDIANKPLVQYKGDTVANIPKQTQDAWKYFLATQGMGMPQYETAGAGLEGIMGGQITADDVAAGKFTDINMSEYMNPFIENVETAAMGNLERQRQLGIMSNADKAAAAGAFGGDRAAVIDAITNAEAARSAGELSAGLRKSGFDVASALATGDIDRAFQAQALNQQAGLTAQQADAQAKLNAASGLLATGGAMSKQRLQDYAGMLDIGRQQQDQQQKEIAADMAKFYEKRDYDIERLNILLTSLGMSPYGQTQTTVADNPAAAGGGMDFASMGMGLLSLFGGLFSDREAKTDITKLGKDPITDLDMYAFRYKDDPKSYPKVVGPMAQDVEKKFKGATRKIGKRRIIKSKRLARAHVPRFA